MLYNNPKTWSKNIDYKTFFNSRCSEKCSQDFCSLGILKKSLSDVLGRSTYTTQIHIHIHNKHIIYHTYTYTTNSRKFRGGEIYGYQM